MVYKFFVLLVVAILGCKGISSKGEKKKENQFLECSTFFNERVTYIEVVPMTSSLKMGLFAVNKEVYDFGNGVSFTNYSIAELDEDGNFDRLVEERNNKIDKFKSVFTVNRKEYEVQSIIKDNTAAPYKFTIDSIGHNDNLGVFVVNVSADCEACFERLVYKVLLLKDRSPNYILCDEYLSSE